MSRLLPILIAVVVVVGGGYLLLTVVHGRDAADITQDAAQGPGALEADRGAAVQDGAAVGDFAVPPPTSGPHARKTPTREGRLDDATVLTALALGDVVVLYGAAQPPAALERLQERISGGPFDPELAAAGQMVVLVRRQGVEGIEALAWRRRLTVQAPNDPQLLDFADAWLGAGAPG